MILSSVISVYFSR